MKKFNWSNVEATSDNYATPPAGGYVLCICDVEDVPAKEYLKVFYDIIGVADPANAQFEGYYGKRSDRSNGGKSGNGTTSHRHPGDGGNAGNGGRQPRRRHNA